MNKVILTLVITLLVFIFNVSAPLLAGEISPREHDLIHKISATIDHLDKNRDLVWHDFNLSDTPVIITFSNQHIYAFGLKSDDPHWISKEEEGTKILFSDSDYWGVTKVHMQDKFNIDGQEAFVFNINENEKNGHPDRSILVLVHELFHRYQFAHFKKMEDVGEYVDQLDSENLSLIVLEERLLVDFLRVSEDKKMEVLKNYLAVNQTRNQLIHPSSVKWERFQQVMEGLADYTSTETFDTFPTILKFRGDKHLQYVLLGYIYSDDPQELAVKWRHYGVGATLGKALDFLKVSDWKGQVELGESQASILEKTVVMSSDEIASRFEAVKTGYGYDKIKSQMESKIHGFSEMIDHLMSDYKTQEGVVATIEKPHEVAINGGGSSYGIYHLENGMTVSVKDKSFSASTDQSWKIKLKEIPFLFQNCYGSRILKVDSDLKVIVDGKTYSIEELKKDPQPKVFNTLSWNCKTSNFESKNREGKLIVNDEGLSVIFN